MTARSSNSGIEADPRWRRLQSRRFECPSCGKTHTGVFDIAYDSPAVWTDSTTPISNADIAPGMTHFLAEDFCILEDEHYFVRCVLGLPILGTDTAFGLGVWSSLSNKNFTSYMESFRDRDQGRLGPWFGWFSNRLSGYPDTLNLKCRVHPRDDDSFREWAKTCADCGAYWAYRRLWRNPWGRAIPIRNSLNPRRQMEQTQGTAISRRLLECPLPLMRQKQLL